MSLPYFNLYPRDFEADTSHLSLEEDGAYNRLLRLCWMTPGCSLPDDDAWIMRRMRVDQDTYDRVVRVVLAEFFTRKSGRVRNARIAREYEQSSAAHEKRVLAGKSGGKAKALKTNNSDTSKAKAIPKQPEPEPEPEPEESNSVADATDGEAVDPAKAVWDAGVRVLGASGVSDRQARSLVGKLRKDHPGQDSQILSAIMDCGRAGAVDPIPWITARLRPATQPDLAAIFAKLDAESRQK